MKIWVTYYRSSRSRVVNFREKFASRSEFELGPPAEDAGSNPGPGKNFSRVTTQNRPDN